VRVVGVDVGARRIGIAVSDLTRTLARPLTVLRPNHQGEGVGLVAKEVARLADEEDGVKAVVVGLPSHLDGSPSEMTEKVRIFAKALQSRIGLPIAFQDERLSSREAESRLAVREKDWRMRKARLDAAAAAVILQDYLDANHA